jgi:hypothetical protein
MPVYGWIALVIVMFLGLATSSLLAWRRKLVNDLVAYIEKNHPEWRVESRSNSALVLRRGDDVTQFSLLNLRAAASQIRGDAATDTAARNELFAASLAALTEQVALLEQSADSSALLDRIHPRIVNETFVTRLPDPATWPRRTIGAASLYVVYVLDSEHAVSYIDDGALKTLGVDEPVLYAHAIANLSRRWPVEVTREAVESGKVVVTKALDTYDAARLLLLPERMRDNEEVAVLIPDRDTLVIAPVPADRDWSRLRRLARNRAGDTLCDVPLLVSSAGIRAA